MQARIASSATISDLHSLPDYTPSPAVPHYAEHPSSSERRLLFIPRSHRVLPISTWTKKFRGVVTVNLHAQEETTKIPTYGRNGIVRGEVNVEPDFKEICREVTVKLEGRTSVAISDGGNDQKSLFCQTDVLWTKSESATACPETLSFRVHFPSTMMVGTQTRPLPPSYQYDFSGVPGLSIGCLYTLTILIKSKWKLNAWGTKKNINVPLRYYPRTCPPLPVPPNMLPFYNTIKTLPEEWKQVVSTMSTRTSSGLEPVECHLYIPKVQTFAITDTVPFFLQLRAPSASLRAFVSQISTNQSQQIAPNLASHLKLKPTVRVFLYRQVRAEIEGQRAWRTIILGEGKLAPLAPTAQFIESCASLDDIESLDWEGEVKCEEEVSVGGFSLEKLVVKDFIVLGLVPPSPQKSPIFEHQHAHPIRLVTDQYVETVMPDRS